MKLYEIAQAFEQLQHMELDEQTLNDTLESLNFDFEEKADNIACIIKTLEAEAVAITDEAKNLLKRAQAKQQKAEYLKEYLLNTFRSLKKDKLETSRNVIKLKKNPVSVHVEDDFEDGNYLIEKVSLQVDKAKLKEDLKNGLSIEGARLIQNERLEVK